VGERPAKKIGIKFGVVVGRSKDVQPANGRPGWLPLDQPKTYTKTMPRRSRKPHRHCFHPGHPRSVRWSVRLTRAELAELDAAVPASGCTSRSDYGRFRLGLTKQRPWPTPEQQQDVLDAIATHAGAAPGLAEQQALEALLATLDRALPPAR
jgi:hypothetical protein